MFSSKIMVKQKKICDLSLALTLIAFFLKNQAIECQVSLQSKQMPNLFLYFMNKNYFDKV